MNLSTWLARRWWLLLLLFVVIGGSAAVNHGHPVLVALGVAAGLAVLAVDWWLPAVLVNGALVGTYFALGGDNGPVFFTIVAAAFLAAMCARVRRWLPYVAVSAVAVWAGLLVRGLRFEELEVNAWQSLGVGALMAAAVSVATAARLRRTAERDRRDRAVSDEKLRMAQELHDGVGHGLSVIAMQAGAALHVLDTDPARARASLEAIRATSRESLDALRAELATMSAGSAASAGSSGTAAPRRPATGMAELPALVERVRAAGLRVDVVDETREVPDRVGEVVHAVVQESLTNVLRHARAGRATVELRPERGVLVVTVADDGRGGSVPEPGMGIAGMRSRVEGVDGRFTAGPVSVGEPGFLVRAELPLAAG